MNRHSAYGDFVATTYEQVLSDICNMNWSDVTEEDLVDIAWAYYYFSVQFRENLEIARELYPDDIQLQQLDLGERNTENLSPWPGVAETGEKMNHDEFMRRALTLRDISATRRRRLEKIGQAYLKIVRAADRTSCALSIASYEDGGLQSVFECILKAENWDGPLLQAFKHFLTEHIRFDSDPEQGHGALCRHLKPDHRVLCFWRAFKEMLVEAVPALAAPCRAPIGPMSKVGQVIDF
jgi:hypothetical protein